MKRATRQQIAKSEPRLCRTCVHRNGAECSFFKLSVGSAFGTCRSSARGRDDGWPYKEREVPHADR